MNKYQRMLKVLLIKKTRRIKDKQMRKFCVLALKAAPDYFWTEPASTSGKHHGGETLVEHVLYCIEYANAHVRMLESGRKNKWVQRQKDIFYTALILHDCFRSGMPGREMKDKEGKLRTDDLHTIYAPRALRYINLGTKENPRYAYYSLPWSQIEDAMACHYGPWSPIIHVDPTIDRDFFSVALHVFLVDYVVSRDCVCRRFYHPEIEELRRNDILHQQGEIQWYGIPRGYPENTRDVNRHLDRESSTSDFEDKYGPA